MNESFSQSRIQPLRKRYEELDRELGWSNAAPTLAGEQLTRELHALEGELRLAWTNHVYTRRPDAKRLAAIVKDAQELARLRREMTSAQSPDLQPATAAARAARFVETGNADEALKVLAESSGPFDTKRFAEARGARPGLSPWLPIVGVLVSLVALGLSIAAFFSSGAFSIASAGSTPTTTALPDATIVQTPSSAPLTDSPATPMPSAPTPTPTSTPTATPTIPPPPPIALHDLANQQLLLEDEAAQVLDSGVKLSVTFGEGSGAVTIERSLDSTSSSQGRTLTLALTNEELDMIEALLQPDTPVALTVSAAPGQEPLLVRQIAAETLTVRGLPRADDAPTLQEPPFRDGLLGSAGNPTTDGDQGTFANLFTDQDLRTALKNGSQFPVVANGDTLLLLRSNQQAGGTPVYKVRVLIVAPRTIPPPGVQAALGDAGWIAARLVDGE